VTAEQSNDRVHNERVGDEDRTQQRCQVLAGVDHQVAVRDWTHTTAVRAIEVAMIALGVGVAVVIAPATESIMSTLPGGAGAAQAAAAHRW